VLLEVPHPSPIGMSIGLLGVLKRQNKIKDFGNKSQETGIRTLLCRVQKDVHQTLLHAILYTAHGFRCFRDVFCQTGYN